MNRIEVVVGAQYGSEAKGHVTQRLVDRRLGLNLDGTSTRPVVNVRVAGPNAGHTAYDSKGRKYALRSVPVGAVSAGPVTLVIAPGSEVDPGVLISELEWLKNDGHLEDKIIYVSPHATLITDDHKLEENVASGYEDMVSGKNLVERIGSTGKGIGAARAGRIMREAKRVGDDQRFMDSLRGYYGVRIADYEYQSFDHVVIEGTQGYGLGLHGPFYPQCTSSDCRAIDFMAMAGINPWGERVSVWAVARMYPIRVAGNSGPLKGETTWEALGLPEERTTVTNKVRRVGAWDGELVRRAVAANGGASHVWLALTMVDQKFPKLAGLESPTEINDYRSWRDFNLFADEIRKETWARVAMVTTGPTTGFFL